MNNLNEDIKILERMLNKESGIYKTNKRGNKEIKFEVNSRYYEALERVIKVYKELEEKNSLLIQQNITYKRNINDLKHNNIPVSLVEEKIEEIKNETWYIDCGVEAKQSCIEVLQELLEKRK